jgi:hypothetical protein
MVMEYLDVQLRKSSFQVGPSGANTAPIGTVVYRFRGTSDVLNRSGLTTTRWEKKTLERLQRSNCADADRLAFVIIESSLGGKGW